MSAIDIIILVILALFVYKGVKLGLIESIGGILGLFVGAYMAGRYYQQVGDMLSGVLFGSQILANVLGFILVFIVVNRGIALLFWIIGKIFNLIAIIPFLRTFNHLLGGIFGLIEGVIFIGIIVFFLSLIPFTQGFGQKVEQSRFAGILETVGKIADPFIPDYLGDWTLGTPKLPFDLPQKLNDLKLGSDEE
ncbi:MAG: CvpA family protein [Candidatus Komeilibacteria bacterium]|nr:CvpA family protein [Candidatus Komeilibacteria bacterium]